MNLLLNTPRQLGTKLPTSSVNYSFFWALIAFFAMIVGYIMYLVKVTKGDPSVEITIIDLYGQFL